MFYLITNASIKISILCLYRRIFPKRWLSYALLSVGIFTVGQTIALCFTTIFESVPISSRWNPHKGHYLNFSAVSIAASTLNVATDIIILSLPIPIVWRLQAPRSRKVLILTTFLLGGL